MSSIVKFNKDSPLQKIRASFLDDEIVLSDKEKDTKEKIRFVFTLRLRHSYSRSSAIDLLMGQYPKISLATAYRIYNKATFVYGELDQTDARAERMLLREHYWNLYVRASDANELFLAKNMLDEYKKLFDFSETDSELYPGKLKAHEYHIKVDRQTLKLMKEQLSKGSVDYNKYPNIEDVDFKDVTDEESS